MSSTPPRNPSSLSKGRRVLTARIGDNNLRAKPMAATVSEPEAVPEAVSEAVKPAPAVVEELQYPASRTIQKLLVAVESSGRSRPALTRALSDLYGRARQEVLQDRGDIAARLAAQGLLTGPNHELGRRVAANTEETTALFRGARHAVERTGPDSAQVTVALSALFERGAFNIRDAARLTVHRSESPDAALGWLDALPTDGRSVARNVRAIAESAVRPRNLGTEL